jgi:glycosyltransferase involved in cell wall biosynthesis
LARHVCFVVGTLGQGGAERQLYYMLRALTENGHRASVLCLTKGEYWEGRISELAIPFVWVGAHAARAIRLFRIIREVRRLQPDILQSSHFFTNVPAALAGLILGIPAVGALRNDCLSEVADAGRALGALNLRIPRLLAANSRLAIDNACSQGVSPDRLFHLPNVVDCHEFQTVVRSQHDKVRIVTAGRLVPQKRQDRFIRLISRLRCATAIPVEGIIVGDGPLHESLQREAEKLHLTPDHLIFRGLAKEMGSVYREADLFVLTSDWEGTPNVVLEAMASGVPVIATNVGGIRDVIEDGISGILVNAKEEDELFVRVKQLVEDPSRRYSIAESGRRRVEAEFSYRKLPEYLESLHHFL